MAILKFILRFFLAVLRRIGALARPTNRFLAYIFVLVAIVALVSDMTPYLDGTGPMQATPLAQHWEAIVPKALGAAQKSVEAAAPDWLWDPIIVSILAVPTFILFGALSLLTGFAGRRRREIDLYVN